MAAKCSSSLPDNMSIRKIAYISFIKDPWGGSEQLWYLSALEALNMGLEVVVSSLDVGEMARPLQELSEKGARLYFRRGFINPNWSRKERIVRKLFYAIADLIQNPFSKVVKEKPDCIVFTGASYSMLLNQPLYRLARKRNIPLLLNIQVNIEYTRPINQEEARFLREMYQYAALSTFVSERNLRVTERHLAQRLPNAVVVRNPVNLKSMELLEMPAGETIRMAIVANLLVNHKGHDLLLEVLSQPKWRQRPVELHIYGAGFDQTYIQELIVFFSLEDRVFLEGKATDIRNVWATNHLLVMPSLNEGMALAVVEAMLCGRTVVTTDVGGNLEWITDGVDGFVAGGANVWSFDRALERAWSRKAEWQEIGKRAHQRALQLHDPLPGKTFLDLILTHGRRT